MTLYNFRDISRTISVSVSFVSEIDAISSTDGGAIDRHQREPLCLNVVLLMHFLKENTCYWPANGRLTPLERLANLESTLVDSQRCSASSSV